MAFCGRACRTLLRLASRSRAAAARARKPDRCCWGSGFLPKSSPSLLRLAPPCLPCRAGFAASSYTPGSVASISTDATGADALQVEISRKKGEIKRLAELCLRTVVKSLKAPTRVRSHYPTPSEISHLKSGREMDVKVHLSDGENLTCKVDSWTTIGQLLRNSSEILGVTLPNARIFCMYEVSNSGEEHALLPEERVLDIVSFHYHDSARSSNQNSEELFSSFKFKM